MDSNGLEGLLRLPEDREKHQRGRELIALLVLAVAVGRPERLKVAAGWLSARRLVGWPAPTTFPTEDVIELDSEPKSFGNIEEADAVVIGQRLVLQTRGILTGSRRVCLTASKDALATPMEWARETADAEPIAVRRPIRWRLQGIETRGTVYDLISDRQLPPTMLALALAAKDAEPGRETRELARSLKDRYREMGWPGEFVRVAECSSRKDLLSWLAGCRDHILHIAGHLGPTGLQVGDELVEPDVFAALLNDSEVRLVVLNGCEGGRVSSPLAVEYLTLADRIVRDGRVSEVVAHRVKITDADALAFAILFYNAFFGKSGGFDPARAAFHARKAGSLRLRLSPVVISQR